MSKALQSILHTRLQRQHDIESKKKVKVSTHNISQSSNTELKSYPENIYFQIKNKRLPTCDCKSHDPDNSCQICFFSYLQYFPGFEHCSTRLQALKKYKAQTGSLKDLQSGYEYARKKNFRQK